MMTKPKVTVVGSFNMDLLIRTPRMPVKGETILGGPFLTGPGGKGANQAVAAARLDADVTMVVKLGQDAFGDQAMANLTREGVRPDFVLRDGTSHTGVAFIIVDDDGENMIVVAAGTNDLLTPADVDAARDAIAGADVLLVELESPLETVERAVRLAHEAGVTVQLNPAPGRPLDAALLSLVDVRSHFRQRRAVLAYVVWKRQVVRFRQHGYRRQELQQFRSDLAAELSERNDGSLGNLASSPLGRIRQLSAE